ncbi:MAG: hypothetical protein NTV42_06695 [Chloroflexi bacterium]|nr:hypothetical protein [Chloroflexota bacterium]
MPICKFLKAVSALLLLLTVHLLIGCAPQVSQEQYNSMQAELKSTKEQLVAARAELAGLKSQPAPAPVIKDPLDPARKTLAAMKPYLDFSLLILDEEITLSQQNTKEITVSYANMQYADQRNRLNDLVKRFDDKEFAAAAESAWSESLDTKSRWEALTQTYTTLRDRLKNNFDTLSKQLSP